MIGNASLCGWFCSGYRLLCFRIRVFDELAGGLVGWDLLAGLFIAELQRACDAWAVFRGRCAVLRRTGQTADPPQSPGPRQATRDQKAKDRCGYMIRPRDELRQSLSITHVPAQVGGVGIAPFVFHRSVCSSQEPPWLCLMCVLISGRADRPCHAPNDRLRKLLARR